MFGFYRFILSIIVVLVHLKFIAAPWSAWYAVFAFYVLSGFLMTAILNQTYGFTRAGLMRFWINRFLRLYPPYYLVCALSAIYMVLFGTLNQLNAGLQLPRNGWDWFTAISIIGRVGFFASHIGTARLIPNAWSLSIEVSCYALLAFYFAKSEARLWLLFLAGAIATSLTLLHYGDVASSFLDRYIVIQAGFMPYASGGLLFFGRNNAKKIMTGIPMPGVLVIIAANIGCGFLWDSYSSGIGLYASILLSCMIVIKLYDLSPNCLDAFLGKLAYPIFISHWVIASVTTHYVATPYAMYVAVAATVLFSYAMVLWVDEPIDRLRTFIKKGMTNR